MPRLHAVDTMPSSTARAEERDNLLAIAWCFADLSLLRRSNVRVQALGSLSALIELRGATVWLVALWCLAATRSFGLPVFAVELYSSADLC